MEKMDTIVDGEKNEISKALQLLENEYLIENNDRGYRVTYSGIDKYEDVLPVHQ